MSRFLVDQGLPRRAVSDLRDRGWDIQHVSDIGMQRSFDADILAYADEHAMVVVTHDSDFSRLLATTAAIRPSVIHLRIPRVDRARLVSALESLVPTVEEDLTAGCIVSVDEAGARVRRLPIG